MDSSDPAEAIIADVKHLSSYNWIEAPEPTIAVPGSPALWSAPQGSRQIKKDSGFVYIAQNAIRHPNSPLEPDSKPSVKDDSSTGDNLTEILHPLSLTLETTSTVQASVESELTIKREGQAVSRESTLEIKTRVFHKPLELSEVTPQLVRAYHQRVVFSRPEVEDVTTAMKDWEKGNQDDIKKLIALVNRILRVTRNRGRSSIIRYDPREDKLVIKQVERKKMLPDDLYSR
ncbi:geranylgeranyl pyrophosphate synthetase [Penicillium majusculum]|nr:geranylgeranyl pyrophosphate synthetase [Penicillium majusculum]